MQNDDQQLHMKTDDARGGTAPNTVRWVLGISLVLAVIAMSIIWIIPALA
ncbi:hypothetical protein [Aurantiacibacter flavus]|uniref:Uncharacterized protein n=1 Tax=Aurantiacibacter flavus TaxID=3145232 RepID=A0ABV0D078_9SPHN